MSIIQHLWLGGSPLGVADWCWYSTSPSEYRQAAVLIAAPQRLFPGSKLPVPAWGMFRSGWWFAHWGLFGVPKYVLGCSEGTCQVKLGTLKWTWKMMIVWKPYKCKWVNQTVGQDSLPFHLDNFLISRWAGPIMAAYPASIDLGASRLHLAEHPLPEDTMHYSCDQQSKVWNSAEPQWANVRHLVFDRHVISTHDWSTPTWFTGEVPKWLWPF